MKNARVRVLKVGAITKLHVTLVDELWIKEFARFDDALAFLHLYGWATYEQTASLHSDAAHLWPRWNIGTDTDFLRKLGFQ